MSGMYRQNFCNLEGWFDAASGRGRQNDLIEAGATVKQLDCFLPIGPVAGDELSIAIDQCQPVRSVAAFFSRGRDPLAK